MGGDERLREELRVSKEILARVVEAYRKIRNTLRYLVANLYDFDPTKDRVDRDGRWRRSTATSWRAMPKWPQKILKAYEDYDYSTIFQTVNAFTTVDLSAFYADVSKDRLYTFAAGPHRTALGADGNVRDGRRTGAAARADSVVYDR